MITRSPFGKTGHLSSRTIFGAAALAAVSQKDADSTLELLLHYGINHIDSAAGYGESELRIGPWMKGQRDKFFLATKTEQRTYRGAMRELEASRKRLKSDVIDLWQMHVLVDEEGWQTAMGPGGALKAFLEARKKGWVRFLGVTGHGVQAPDYHRRSLEKHPFESVLLPWNYPMSLNRDYSQSLSELKNICKSREIAMQTIKGICRRPWTDEARSRDTWYEPLEEQEDIDRAVAFILSEPGFFLNTAGDIQILPRILRAASDFSEGKIASPSLTDMEEMAGKLAMAPLFH